MKLRYFAWLRTRFGCGEETLAADPATGSLPATVAELMALLRARGGEYETVLADTCAIRVAVNHDYAGFDHPLAPGDEVALFPPVTGG